MSGAPLSLDTDPAIERLQVEGWRRMSAEQKAATVTGLTAATFLAAKAGIRDRHPEAGPREQRWRLALIVLGRDLARKVCPDIPSPSPE